MASASGASHQPNVQRHAFSAIQAHIYRERRVSVPSKSYDVFINHRGPDVKERLARPLYNSLQELGIQAFLDSEEKRLGDPFPSTIEMAIKSALAHVAIFSKRYAESPWCLVELVLMLKSKAKIIPVFYEVKPSALRYIEKGVFAEAFMKYEKEERYLEKLEEWKKALAEVSYLNGEELNSSSDYKTIVSAVQEEVKRLKVPGPRLVFAHYLLYYPDSVDVLKEEIRLAHSKGIDGFALNTNVWRPKRADAIYQAAKDVDPSFKLFFSADIHKDDNGTLSPDKLITMLTRYADHPNQMRYAGKLFFTAWLGSDDSWWAEYGYSSALDGWKDVFQKAGGKDDFFFVPFFPTDGSVGGVEGTLEQFNDIIDGLFAWDTSAWPFFSPDFQNPSDSSDQNYLSACKAVEKVYMASASPWFFNNFNCQVKGNYQGPGLWIKKWEQLIQLSPPLVQILTWNNWAESSYVSPPLSLAAADVAKYKEYTHQAFLELGQHYISWYKSSSPPPIDRDSLYMFYYTHSKNVKVPAEGCAVVHSDEIADKLYVTAMLTAPATLELRSGSASQTFDAQGGISTWSMDFQEGQQVAILKRGDTEVSTLKGSKYIRNSGVSQYNLNVYSTCTACQ